MPRERRAAGEARCMLLFWMCDLMRPLSFYLVLVPQRQAEVIGDEEKMLERVGEIILFFTYNVADLAAL